MDKTDSPQPPPSKPKLQLDPPFSRRSLKPSKLFSAQSFVGQWIEAICFSGKRINSYARTHIQHQLIKQKAYQLSSCSMIYGIFRDKVQHIAKELRKMVDHSCQVLLDQQELIFGVQQNTSCTQQITAQQSSTQRKYTWQQGNNRWQNSQAPRLKKVALPLARIYITAYSFISQVAKQLQALWQIMYNCAQLKDLPINTLQNSLHQLVLDIFTQSSSQFQPKKLLPALPLPYKQRFIYCSSEAVSQRQALTHLNQDTTTKRIIDKKINSNTISTSNSKYTMSSNIKYTMNSNNTKQTNQKNPSQKIMNIDPSLTARRLFEDQNSQNDTQKHPQIEQNYLVTKQRDCNQTISQLQAAQLSFHKDLQQIKSILSKQKQQAQKQQLIRSLQGSNDLLFQIEDVSSEDESEPIHNQCSDLQNPGELLQETDHIEVDLGLNPQRLMEFRETLFSKLSLSTNTEEINDHNDLAIKETMENNEMSARMGENQQYLTINHMSHLQGNINIHQGNIHNSHVTIKNYELEPPPEFSYSDCHLESSMIVDSAEHEQQVSQLALEMDLEKDLRVAMQKEWTFGITDKINSIRQQQKINKQQQKMAKLQQKTTKQQQKMIKQQQKMNKVSQNQKLSTFYQQQKVNRLQLQQKLNKMYENQKNNTLQQNQKLNKKRFDSLRISKQACRTVKNGSQGVRRQQLQAQKEQLQRYRRELQRQKQQLMRQVQRFLSEKKTEQRILSMMKQPRKTKYCKYIKHSQCKCQQHHFNHKIIHRLQQHQQKLQEITLRYERNQQQSTLLEAKYQKFNEVRTEDNHKVTSRQQDTYKGMIKTHQQTQKTSINIHQDGQYQTLKTQYRQLQSYKKTMNQQQSFKAPLKTQQIRPKDTIFKKDIGTDMNRDKEIIIDGKQQKLSKKQQKMKKKMERIISAANEQSNNNIFISNKDSNLDDFLNKKEAKKLKQGLPMSEQQSNLLKFMETLRIDDMARAPCRVKEQDILAWEMKKETLRKKTLVEDRQEEVRVELSKKKKKKKNT